MASEKKRYWVYSHNADGELITTIDEVDELKDAIDAVGVYIAGLYPQFSGVTVRVVDNEADSQTVWMAGPVKRLTVKDIEEEITGPEA